MNEKRRIKKLFHNMSSPLLFEKDNETINYLIIIFKNI